MVTARHEVAQGTHTPASTSKTVAEAGVLWMADGKARKREHGTLEQRRQHLEHHINPFIGGAKLANLTVPRVYAFVDALRDAGRSFAMQRKVLTSLKTMLSFAQKRGYVAQNVVRGERLDADTRGGANEMRAGVEMPTKAELKAMIDAAPAPRWRAFILTAIFTGMRASELRGLRWEDVDLAEQVVHVRQRADAWGTMGRPKSPAGWRTIPLAPIVVNVLKEWRLACPRRSVEKDAKGKVIEPGELFLVFPNGRGNVEMHANIWRRFFAPLQVEAGIVDAAGRPKYGLHALRHAAVSLFIEQEWQPKKVQSVIGHASLQMTYDRYGKLFPDAESDRAAMAKVEAALLA